MSARQAADLPRVRQDPDDPRTHWIFRDGDEPAFHPCVFDTAAASGAIVAAGRGNTRLLTWQGAQLVHREYRRGGAIRYLSERHYLATGLERSRALREFRLLCALEALGLPVSPAFAARRQRRGMLERCVLITRRVPGATLAARLLDAGPGQSLDGALDAIGRCIARFHAAGVWHADLNAHNILVDGEGATARVTLIDFDRGLLGSPRSSATPSTAARGNVQRLARSVGKVVDKQRAAKTMRAIERGWQDGHATVCAPSASAAR